MLLCLCITLVILCKGGGYHENSNSELCGTFHKNQFCMPVCQFLFNFSLFKIEFCFGIAQNTIVPFQNLLESLSSYILSIPLLPDRCKPFLSACHLSAASQAQPDNGAPTEKLTPHEHANAWRDRRSALPPSPTS